MPGSPARRRKREHTELSHHLFPPLSGNLPLPSGLVAGPNFLLFFLAQLHGLIFRDYLESHISPTHFIFYLEGGVMLDYPTITKFRFIAWINLVG